MLAITYSLLEMEHKWCSSLIIFQLIPRFECWLSIYSYILLYQPFQELLGMDWIGSCTSCTRTNTSTHFSGQDQSVCPPNHQPIQLYRHFRSCSYQVVFFRQWKDELKSVFTRTFSKFESKLTAWKRWPLSCRQFWNVRIINGSYPFRNFGIFNFIVFFRWVDWILYNKVYIAQ